MNSEEYREQIRKEVESETAGQSRAGRESAGVDDAANAERLLAILADPKENAEARLAALHELQQLAFNVAVFALIRPRFIATLRALVDDPDQKLRETAIETLAQEKDEYVQRRLLAGLNGDEPPVVDDEKAIQFLGYDIHADYFPVARRLARESPDAGTRREAVKLLSADTDSADLLSGIFGDKGEDAEVRSASASALLSVDPVRFEDDAKRAIVDESDAESVRAASLTALTYFGNPTALANDADFIDQVSKVDTRPAVRGARESGEESTSDDEGALAKAVRVFHSRLRG